MSEQKKYIFFFILLLTASLNLFSQEASIYENYYLSPFIINSGATGAEYYPMAEFSVKKQWLSFPDAPTTFLLAASYRVGKYDFYDPKGFVNKGPLKLSNFIGLGAALYRDNDGPLSNTGMILSYAYHFPVNSFSKLSLGISGIGTIYSFNSSVLKPDQSNDSYLLSGNDNMFRANINLGVYYYSNLFFAGLSANKILPDITNVNNQISSLPSYFLIGGYKFKTKSNSFDIEPSLAIKKTGNQKISVDIHTKVYLKRLNWVAVSYSTSGKINFQFVLNLYKMFCAGYNYEYSLSKISSSTYGSHEIYLGINIGLTGVEGISRTGGNIE
jgi:type IX secretion system PorP/SprF family membrane protein